MKKNDVRIGGVYSAKISDKLVSVRIDRENPAGGWDATNLQSKRTVRIRSARKLRGEVRDDGAGAKTPPTATKTAKAAKTAPRAKDSDKKPRPDGKTSALDAAAMVLKKSKEPMRCKEIVDAMLTQKLWSTTGQTPAATLSSAILREIQKKGKESRFRKVIRGQFDLQ